MALQQAATKFEVDMQEEINLMVYHASRFEFLKGHNGIRPNSLIGMAGTTGSGKTTLFKCIIAETAIHSKVLVWLSEETVVEYQMLISFLDASVLKNIIFVEERNIPTEFKEDQDTFLQYFEQMVEEAGCDIVFCDNVTTSKFYNQSFGFHGQTRATEFLMKFVKTKCTFFYVAHTASEITDNYGKVVTPENMRGAKELPMATEYFYVLQKFTTNDKIYNVIRVAKFRHHKEAAGWYALKFEQQAYVGDSKVPFELINKIFKSRDYLGRATPKAPKDPQDIPQRKMNI